MPNKFKFIVITGGPGAGKTAVIELARRKFCRHMVVLPEAASIIFSGGFWRLPSESARRAAQRAIYHVQAEMEELVVSENRWQFGLCDRGTLDGLAYWPGSEESFWSQVRSDLKTEMAKYAVVIHLRTPDSKNGYNRDYFLRTETAEEARRIDNRIEEIWSQHPRYFQIPNFPNFTEKAEAALDLLQREAPDCCSPALVCK